LDREECIFRKRFPQVSSPVKENFSDDIMSDASGPAGPANAGSRNFQLNPERAPALIAKWQKLLGKDLERIEVHYSADGVSVEIYGLGVFSKIDSEGDRVPLSVAEYKAIKAKAAEPSQEEALRAFRNKFELRLNKEFPATGPKSASEADIQEWLNARPFNERRVMLMSGKQYKTAFPNGVPAPAT